MDHFQNFRTIYFSFRFFFFFSVFTGIRAKNWITNKICIMKNSIWLLCWKSAIIDGEERIRNCRCVSVVAASAIHAEDNRKRKRDVNWRQMRRDLCGLHAYPFELCVCAVRNYCCYYFHGPNRDSWSTKVNFTWNFGSHRHTLAHTYIIRNVFSSWMNMSHALRQNNKIQSKTNEF